MKTIISRLSKLISDNTNQDGDNVQQNADPSKTNAPETRPFGMIISDAEDFISQKSYKDALALYRSLDSQLAGSGDFMKIQFVREKIENLLHLIKENPDPAYADIIDQEKKAAEERFHTTVYEAENYFSHKLYKESLFLYRKLQKEWAKTDDIEKKSFLLSKIQALRELEDDIFMEEEDEPAPFIREVYKAEEEFIGGYAGDEKDVHAVPIPDPVILPELKKPEERKPEIQETSTLAHDQLYEDIIREAENYSSHELYKEGLQLYTKLENDLTTKKLIVSDYKKKIAYIRERALVLKETYENPFRTAPQPVEPSKVAYLDKDGSITNKPLENYGRGPGFSQLARWLTLFFLRNKTLLSAVYILLIALGLYSLFTIPVENMPSVDRGEAYITTNYYGASAEEVESLITTPIEKALEGFQNIESVQARSYRNFSRVHIKFTEGSDYRDVFSRIKLQVQNIRGNLPESCEDPRFQYANNDGRSSVIQVNLFGELPETSRSQLAVNLKTELNAIKGVEDIEVSGQSKNEFIVSLSLEKLRSLGVTFSDAVEAMRSAGEQIPSGNAGAGQSKLTLRAGSEFKNEEDILNVIIRKDNSGNFIRIKDVVTNVMMSHPDPSNITSVNGNDTASLIVRKEDSANSIQIAKQVKKLCADFRERYKDKGLKIAFTNDSSQEIIHSISVLAVNLILGLGLVILILWLALGFRNAIVTALGIPFSILCTLSAMKWAGISVNSINLFAFILVLGIIVDDAIVIMENVYRHQKMDKPLRFAVVDGVAETFRSVITSTLIMAAVFLPLLMISGPVGSFFAMVPLVVCFALVASLFEATAFLPTRIFGWGAGRIQGASPDNGDTSEKDSKPGLFSVIWYVFDFLLTLSLKHRWKMLIATCVLFIASLTVALMAEKGNTSLIKVKFLPDNSMRYRITVTLPSSAPIAKTDAVVRDISRFILSLNEMQTESVSGTAGYYEEKDYSVLNGSQYGQIIVSMPQQGKALLSDNPEKETEKHMDYVRNKLNLYLAEKYPGLDEQPKVNIFPENNGPPSGKAFSIKILGDNLEREIEVSNRIMAFLKNNTETQDLMDIRDDRAANVNVVKYSPIQETAYDLGISTGHISELISGALNGATVGTYRTVTEEVPLKMKVARESDNQGSGGLETPQDILFIPLIKHSVGPIPIKDVANVISSSEPDSRGRFNGKSNVTLSADIRSGSRLSADRVRSLVNMYFQSFSVDYPDITLMFSGDSPASGKTFNAVYLGLAIAFILIYLILALRFGDYFQPAIVLSSVGLAIIGATFGLLVTKSLFTVGTLMVVVALASVTVNNSLILINFINIRINEGQIMRTAVKEACRARIRPVFLTTATLVMGLLPMALGIPYTSAEWAPMAATFVVGLAVSTFFTLLMIPVEYELAMLIKNNIKETL